MNHFYMISINYSVVCPAGTYRNTTFTTCTKCTGDTVSEEKGASVCTSCEGGKEANVNKTKCGGCILFDFT